jgi:hypothetical protein
MEKVIKDKAVFYMFYSYRQIKLVDATNQSFFYIHIGLFFNIFNKVKIKNRTINSINEIVTEV